MFLKDSKRALVGAPAWATQLTISKQGREGIVIVKTTQAILIGHYGEGHIAGNAATTVEQLADYLIKQGY